MHAAIAASNSDTLRGALRASWAGAAGPGGGMRTWQGRQVRVVVLAVGTGLGLLPAAGVRKLVDSWYTGRLQLGEAAEDGLRDVMDVMVAADYLQAWSGVAAMCAAHVRTLRVSHSCWAKLWQLGQAWEQPALLEPPPISGFESFRRQAILIAAHDFKVTVAHRSWVDAPLGAVRELLGRGDMLSVRSEDEVLAATLAWADRAAEGGADALAELLPLVRLPQVSRGALARLWQDARVASSQACQGLLAEAAAWTPAAAGGRLWGPRSAHALVVVGYGWAQRYDAATSRWTELPASMDSHQGEAAASLGGRVYLAGVYDRDEDFLQVACFDPAAAGGAGAWAFVEPMGTARESAAAASLDGLLYVAGGMGADGTGLHTVERYSPASDTWEAVASMISARYCHQLVAMGGFMYAIGGFGGAARRATAERYDPATNTWTPIASMAIARCQFAAAAMGGFLYVTGGEHVGSGLRSCERYDPASDTWSRIADLPEPRMYHALACLNGSLYAVGGRAAWDGAGSISPPWRYDATANAWVVAPLAAGSAEMESSGGAPGWAAV